MIECLTDLNVHCDYADSCEPCPVSAPNCNPNDPTCNPNVPTCNPNLP